MLSKPAGGLATRTSIIGRQREILAIRELLLNGPERLVTLTGVGGSGKTRLALEVAGLLAPTISHGVSVVELARVSDPLLVPEALAGSLGITGESSSELLTTLFSTLELQAHLIVLDNCEHLIDACAHLVDQFLSACPRLRILATSREPLQISGERQYRILPLPVPRPDQIASLEALAGCPSVELFVERAEAVEPGFQLTSANGGAVAQICTMLDGIPLALELAAARIRVLSAEQIVRRLDDCFRLLASTSRSSPTRQQTLKATMDWSYDLLSAEERAAFRRLAIFTGGWSLEAAEAVCVDDRLEVVDALELLTHLVDKSLVLVEEREGEARYRLLEPVRQYALQLLASSGELAATEKRLATFCVTLAEQAEPELHGPRQVLWLRRLDGQFENIRTVIRWAEQREDAEAVLRLAGLLDWYFWMRRHLREGERWLKAALARGSATVPPVRAKALSAAALVSSFLGEYAQGLAFAREAITLYEQLGDVGGRSWTTITLSHILLDQGELGAARAMGEEALGLARRSSSPWHLGYALSVLGEIVRRQGDSAQALDLNRQALQVFRNTGNTWAIGMAVRVLAFPQRERADFKRVAAVSDVQLSRDVGDYAALASALEYLAGRCEPQYAEERVKLLAAAHCLRHSLGMPLPIQEREDVERHLREAQGHLGEARFLASWAEGCALSLEQVLASVLSEEAPRPVPRLQRPGRPVAAPDALTRRELEVARLLALGYTDRQIAHELTITEGTAGVHVHRILEKLGFRSRMQVAEWAQAQPLTSTHP